MTLIFKGETIITRAGKEIIFDRFSKVNNITIGCFDIYGTFYQLSEIIY